MSSKRYILSIDCRSTKRIVHLGLVLRGEFLGNIWNIRIAMASRLSILTALLRVDKKLTSQMGVISHEFTTSQKHLTTVLFSLLLHELTCRHQTVALPCS